MRVSPRPFWTVSLGHWLQLAREAGTPHVDAVRIATVRVADLMYYDVEGPHRARLKAAWDAMTAARRPGTMLRWDCGASAHLKHLMARGRLPADEVEELQTLTIDERIFDMSSEYPSDEIDVWQRPWIRDRMAVVDGYPVEYRAFIRHGDVVGVSSYYPQRPLPRNDAEIGAVHRLAQGLADTLAERTPLTWPHPLPGHPEAPGQSEDAVTGPRGVHATADFAVTRDTGVLLIEGGPPHFAGAHPCCFEGRGTTTGVALEKHPAARRQ